MPSNTQLPVSRDDIILNEASAEFMINKLKELVIESAQLFQDISIVLKLFENYKNYTNQTILTIKFIEFVKSIPYDLFTYPKYVLIDADNLPTDANQVFYTLNKLTNVNFLFSIFVDPINYDNQLYKLVVDDNKLYDQSKIQTSSSKIVWLPMKFDQDKYLDSYIITDLNTTRLLFVSERLKVKHPSTWENSIQSALLNTIYLQNKETIQDLIDNIVYHARDKQFFDAIYNAKTNTYIETKYKYPLINMFAKIYYMFPNKYTFVTYFNLNLFTKIQTTLLLYESYANNKLSNKSSSSTKPKFSDATLSGVNHAVTIVDLFFNKLNRVKCKTTYGQGALYIALGDNGLYHLSSRYQNAFNQVQIDWKDPSTLLTLELNSLTDDKTLSRLKESN
ncbi:MAG: hypothetical protein EBX37_11970, partial [Alphaproteobacteria bacterium]|nr:hypothetical protein [Alphaproteobacteria bacterium]